MGAQCQHPAARGSQALCSWWGRYGCPVPTPMSGRQLPVRVLAVVYLKPGHLSNQNTFNQDGPNCSQFHGEVVLLESLP